MLEQLQEIAKDEKYLQDSKVEFDALLTKLTPNLDDDLGRYKSEIVKIIENEIVSRYYYQKGRVEASLASDNYITEALKVLNNEKLYQEILTTQK